MVERAMRQDARENRERILAAAEEVFGQHGHAGSTEEVARLAEVGIATVFRHFPTKEQLIEAALLRHFDQLTTLATALAGSEIPQTGWRVLIRMMIENGATKLMLISTVAGANGFPESAAAASGRLKAAVAAVLRRAQECGEVRESATVEEVYLLIRGLAQATATAHVPADTLDRAVDIVLAGLSTRSAGSGSD